MGEFPTSTALDRIQHRYHCPLDNLVLKRSDSTTTESDFPRPFVIGYGSSPSRCGPSRFAAVGRTRDLPVPAQEASAHARFFDHAGLSRRSCWRVVHIAFRLRNSVGAQNVNLCEAQWLAYAFPYRRFAVALADGRARLRVDAGRYSFHPRRLT